MHIGKVLKSEMSDVPRIVSNQSSDLKHLPQLTIQTVAHRQAVLGRMANITKQLVELYTELNEHELCCCAEARYLAYEQAACSEILFHAAIAEADQAFANALLQLQADRPQPTRALLTLSAGELDHIDARLCSIQRQTVSFMRSCTRHRQFEFSDARYAAAEARFLCCQRAAFCSKTLFDFELACAAADQAFTRSLGSSDWVR